MRRLCEFAYSDGVECLKPAVAYVVYAGEYRWFCAIHYDAEMNYFQRVARGNFHNTNHARRICKENNL